MNFAFNWVWSVTTKHRRRSLDVFQNGYRRFLCLAIKKEKLVIQKVIVIKSLMFCLMNKKTLKTQILIRTDSYSTMLEIHAIKKVWFIHIVWPDKAVSIVNISTITSFKTVNWSWKVGLNSEIRFLESECPENFVGYENQNIAIEAF